MSFNPDLKDVHLIYDYDVMVDTGKYEKWRYEIWFSHDTRVTYAFHGGPMKGRYNYQKATYQCIRPGELWQVRVNWLEETGTIVSLVYNILNKKITTLIAFSKGHWEHPTEPLARGQKKCWGLCDSETEKPGQGGDTDRRRYVIRAGGYCGDV